MTSARRLGGGDNILKAQVMNSGISAFSSAELGRPASTYEAHAVHAESCRLLNAARLSEVKEVDTDQVPFVSN